MARVLFVFVTIAVLLIAQSTPGRALGQWPNAPYAYPSSSWVGYYLYGTNGNHTGADLWGTQNGLGSQGPSVYSAYAGTVKNLWWLCDMGGGVYETRNYNCAGSPGVIRATKYGVTILNDDGKAAHYWHMADQGTFSSWVEPALAVNQWLLQGTWLGYQGNATGVGTVLLHVHFTVGTNVNADFWQYSVDPSPYVGPNLRHGSPDQPPLGSQATTWYGYNGPINCFNPPCPSP